MTLTTTDKRNELSWARTLLDGHRDKFANGALLLITMERGSGVTDYLRVFMAYDNDGRITSDNVTWAVAKVLGYSLRDRAGQWNIALGGGGYSKPLDITNALKAYYGLDTLNVNSL